MFPYCIFSISLWSCQTRTKRSRGSLIPTSCVKNSPWYWPSVKSCSNSCVIVLSSWRTPPQKCDYTWGTIWWYLGNTTITVIGRLGPPLVSSCICLLLLVQTVDDENSMKRPHKILCNFFFPSKSRQALYVLRSNAAKLFVSVLLKWLFCRSQVNLGHEVQVKPELRSLTLLTKTLLYRFAKFN